MPRKARRDNPNLTHKVGKGGQAFLRAPSFGYDGLMLKFENSSCADVQNRIKSQL